MRLPTDTLFEHAFHDAAIGMALVALDGKWIKVNGALSRILGYSEEELLRTDFQSITHKDDLTKDLAYATSLLCGHIHIYRTEKRYFHKDGHIIWVQLTGSLVRKASGLPDFFIAQIQDITREKYLAEERELFFKLSRELLGVLTKDLKISNLNGSWKKVLGWHEAELRLNSLLEVVHQEDRQKILESLNSSRKIFPGFTCRCLVKEGGYRWIEWTAEPGSYGSICISGRDVTDYHEQVERLSRSILHARG